MKLKIYNRENSQGAAIVKSAKLSCSPKTGLMSINPAAIELLGAKVGDGLVLAQDEKDTENWYVAKNSAGLVLKQGSGGSAKCLTFCSSRAARDLTEQDMTATHFLIAGVPTDHGGLKWFGLIRKPKI